MLSFPKLSHSDAGKSLNPSPSADLPEMSVFMIQHQVGKRGASSWHHFFPPREHDWLRENCVVCVFQQLGDLVVSLHDSCSLSAYWLTSAIGWDCMPYLCGLGSSKISPFMIEQITGKYTLRWLKTHAGWLADALTLEAGLATICWASRSATNRGA